MHAACRALLLLLAFIIFSAELGECRGGFLGGAGGVGGPGGGGTPVPTQPPAPTPTPSRTWLLLPGCCGLYSEWGNTAYSSGGPDHHDSAPTQHAVDIGAGSCSTCPDVFYYDQSNSVTTVVTHFLNSCSSVPEGGERVNVGLVSLNPPSVVQGTVSYLHMTNAISSGSQLGNGAFIGTVHGATPPASTSSSCWDGPHLHQGIDRGTSFATVTHYTGLRNSGSNCEGYPPAPVTYSQQAHAVVPCYALSW